MPNRLQKAKGRLRDGRKSANSAQSKRREALRATSSKFKVSKSIGLLEDTKEMEANPGEWQHGIKADPERRRKNNDQCLHQGSQRRDRQSQKRGQTSIHSRSQGCGKGRGKGRGQEQSHRARRNDSRHSQACEDSIYLEAQTRHQKLKHRIGQIGLNMLYWEYDINELAQDELSSGKLQGFESLLSADNQGLKSDMMTALIEIMTKVYVSIPQSVVSILEKVVHTDSWSRNLSQYIYIMMTETDNRCLQRTHHQIGILLKLMEILAWHVEGSVTDVHAVVNLIASVAGALETKGHPLGTDTTVLLKQLLSCCSKSNAVQDGNKGGSQLLESLGMIHCHYNSQMTTINQNLISSGFNLPLSCEHRLNCGHFCNLSYSYPTYPDHNRLACQKRCERILKCGHQCQQLCSQSCGPCTLKVAKPLSCGHHRDIPCYQMPETAPCLERCPKQLSCGHACRKLCGVPCSKSCTVACGALLDCSHRCPGTCGTCMQGRLHIHCSQKCNRVLVCGHECIALCTRDCPPCKEKCENRCVHSKCPNRCGDPCTPCQEPCPWRCPHYRCTKKCSEACDRPPCDKPCPEKLRCGHPCIGLCGEPCPDKCRVCHNDEVTEIFFGSEDEPDALYVQLEDCGHLFEVKGLDNWMTCDIEEHKSIQLKTCPRCKTPVRRTRRYGNIINETLTDIEEVKARVIRNEEQRNVKINWIQDTLASMRAEFVASVKRLMASQHNMGMEDLSFIENQLKLVKAISQMIRELKTIFGSNLSRETMSTADKLKKMEDWLQEPRTGLLSLQELNKCNDEIHDISLWCYTCYVQSHLRHALVDGQALERARNMLLNSTPLDERSREVARKLVKQVAVFKGDDDDDKLRQERIMIVAASKDFGQGHWYKCPQGHFYAIGNCGGVNESGRCSECKANIGKGSSLANHLQLAEGNERALEMERYTLISFDVWEYQMLNMSK